MKTKTKTKPKRDRDQLWAEAAEWDLERRRLATQEVWLDLFARVSAEIIAQDAQWRRDYGDWKTFKVPSEHQALARQALEAWRDITNAVTKPKARAARRKAVRR